MSSHDYVYSITNLIQVLEDIASWTQLDLGHGERVSNLARKIARRMKDPLTEEQLTLLDYAARIHDLGRIAVDDAIMLKPGPLTTAERGAVEQHPLIGYNFLVRSGLPKEITTTVYYHHEKWNGSGYPKQLKGEEIPLFARIVSIADVYDALVSDRPYRPALSPGAALSVMTRHAGDFDPYLFSLFLTIMREEEQRGPPKK